eukprot:1033651_1
MSNKQHYIISWGGKAYEEDMVTIQLLVYGYCRIITQCVVPPEIVSLCQSYYRVEFDKWDAAHSSINCKINRQLLSRPWSYDASTWSNAFGFKTIARHNYNVWKIKVVELDIGSSASCLVGVVCSDKIKIKNTDLSKEKCVKIHNLNKNDIVTLTLDLRKRGNGKLAYAINLDDSGVVVENISIDLGWKLA